MIRRMTEYEPLLERWSKAAGCLSVRVAAAWECYGGDAPDCAFYAVDDTALLMVHGAGALLCGEVSDLQEIKTFLRMSGAATLLCEAIAAQESAKKRLSMRWNGKVEKCLQPAEFCAAPSLWRLSQSGLLDADPQAYYADVCRRVNRGAALVYTCERDGAAYATAGAYAVTERAAYLSGVAAQETHRRQGCASALVTALCAALSPREVYLICKPPLAAFYGRIGFEIDQELMEFEIGRG